MVEYWREHKVHILTEFTGASQMLLTRAVEPANNEFMFRLRLGDILIFLLALAISISSLFLFHAFSGNEEVHVTTDSGTWIYDLSVDTVVDFEGPIGITTMEIAGGKVHVDYSDCRNQVCVLAGEIESAGEWIACLPNNVFIVIQGNTDVAGEGEVDDASF